MWGPLQWCWKTWSAPDSPQAYQPLMLPAAAALVWLRRNQLKAVYDSTRNRPRGGLWLLVFGCLLMLLAHATQMASVSIGAFVIIVAGVVVRIYGWEMLWSLRTPILFLLTMIPLPGFMIDYPTQELQLSGTRIGASILSNLHIPTVAQGTMLITQHYQVEIAPACSGVGILLPLLVMTLWLLLIMEGSTGGKLFVLMAGFWIALGVNILRIVSMGLIGQISPEIANQLHDANSWLFTAIAFYLVYLTAKLVGIRELCGPISN